MAEKIAIMGSGILAKTFAERARNLGIESYCFSFNSNDVACESVDFFYEVDIFDTAKIIEICANNKIGGIIATTELTILPTAIVANELGLISNSVEVAKNITNKYLTRNKLLNVKTLNQPNYQVYFEGDYPKIEKFPVVVKPIAAGGKRGVKVVYSKNEVPSAIIDALRYSRVEGVLLEDFLIDGVEFSVESISYKGKHYVIQVTQKDTSGPPRCNELGHHQPAKLSKEMRKKVEDVIADTLTVAGIENGPCHTEIKIINDEVYLIELNARPGGDHITDILTELSTGYPIISAIIWISLGVFEGHEPKELKSNNVGICFVTEKTEYLKPIFDICESFDWFYSKNQVSDSPSKIVFNDEEGLNYFIYYDEYEKPDILGTANKLLEN